MSREIQMKIKAKCHRCETEWEYTGNKIKLLKKIKSIYVNCPRCKTSVRIQYPNEKKRVK